MTASVTIKDIAQVMVTLNANRSHQYISVPAVTRDPLPRERQVGPTIRLVPREQQPILMVIDGRESLCIRIAILEVQ